MIYGIGTDIIEIERIETALKNDKFLTKNFTHNEIEYFSSKKNKSESVAAYFAMKESVLKALGCGIGLLSLIDIEILKDELGAPYVSINDRLKAHMQSLNIGSIYVSASHSKLYATGLAVAQKSC